MVTLNIICNVLPDNWRVGHEQIVMATIWN